MENSAGKACTDISKSWINKLRLYSHAKRDELCLIIQALSSEISQAVTLITAIEKQDWNYALSKELTQSKLITALIRFRNSLKEINERETQRKWATQGIVQFADLLKKNPDNTHALCDAIISNLVKYLRASQGAIFLHHDKGKILEGISFFAYNRKKFIERTVQDTEGLIGQCFLEGDIIYISKVPADYVKITSGLGEALPRTVLLVPIKLSEQKLGVIELASFNTFLPYQMEFLKSVSENIAAVLINVSSMERTASLLKQQEEITKALRDKEEQLLQNIEELQSIQDEMKRQNQELEEAKKIIEEKNLEMEILQKREMELVESKLKAQDDIHQTIIKKLQTKIRELQSQPRSQFSNNLN